MVHWSAARNEERPSSNGYTIYQPVVNCGFRSSDKFVRASEFRTTHSRHLTLMPLGARGSVVSGANRPFGAPFCPAALPCAALPRPARSMSGFGVRQVQLNTPCLGPVQDDSPRYADVETKGQALDAQPRPPSQDHPRLAWTGPGLAQIRPRLEACSSLGLGWLVVRLAIWVDTLIPTTT